MILMYLRKSRSDDPNETVAEVLAKHERILQDYAEKYLDGHIDNDCIYKEVVSGETIESRTEIKKVIQRMKDNNVTGVLVVDPQRLTRGDLVDCGIIVRAFKYSNTKLITPMHTYDLTDKYDAKFVEQELLRGNDYLEYTKEILMRGRIQSLKEGNFIGAVAPIGYDKVKVGKKYTLKPNDKAPMVKRCFELRLDGYGLVKISTLIQEEFGYRMSPNTLRQLLMNKRYIGINQFGQQKRTKTLADDGITIVDTWTTQQEFLEFKGNHEHIIDDDTFNRVQLTFTTQPHTSQKRVLQNKFAGLMKCAKCGGAMSLYKYQAKNHYYYCRNSFCDNKAYYPVIEVDNAIIEKLKQTLDDMTVTVTNDTVDIYTPQIEECNRQIATNEAKTERLYDYLEDGTYTKEVFKKRLEKLQNERKELDDRLVTLMSKSSNKAEIKEKTMTLMQALDVIEDGNTDAQNCNNLLRSIIERIDIADDSISMMMR